MVFVRRYDASNEGFSINEREVWRYAGYQNPNIVVDEKLVQLFEEVKEELRDAFQYQVCYLKTPISWENGMPTLPFSSESKNLAQSLKNSSQVVVFAATIGLEIDKKIARYQHLSKVKALLMQAYGAERIECLCDVFCKEIEEEVRKEGLTCTARFSPGYGDLPLETQREVFALLQPERRVGISLGESLLMRPSKSVTAIFGIGRCVGPQAKQGCSQCEKEDCEFRE